MTCVDRGIGHRVETLRVARGISRETAAAALGLDVEDYARRERGELRFSAHNLFQLVRMFGVALGSVYR